MKIRHENDQTNQSWKTNFRFQLVIFGFQWKMHRDNINLGFGPIGDDTAIMLWVN